MTAITNAPRLPGDQPAAPLVAIELLDDNRNPVVGYVSGDAPSIHGRLAFAANGTHALSPTLSEWTVDLVPNAQIEPAGTVYRITEQRGRAMAAIHIIEVPEAGGPYTVLETLIDEPGSMGSLLLDHLADTADAHDASAVSIEWEDVTSDVAAVLVELDGEITAETAARAAAVTAEAAARDAADDAEAAARSAAVSAEVTARANADTAEAAAREAADDALAADIATEVSEREAADVDLAAAQGAHEGDTLGVHGIADTSALVVTTDTRLSNQRVPTDGSVTGGAGAGAKIAANTIMGGNVHPLAGIPQTAVTNLSQDIDNLEAAVAFLGGDLVTDLAAHTNDTQNVHGITDTAGLVYNSDVRLVDQRTPKANSVDNSKIPVGAIALDRLGENPLDRALHTGTQTADSISDLAIAVRTNRLDQMAAPIAPITMAGQRVTNAATPSASTDLATKEYVDATRAGLLLKADPVRVLATANVNINAPGAAIDSVVLTANVDSVLLAGQVSANDNGLYDFKGAAVPMTRRADANTSGEMRSGTAVWVLDGTYADQRWALITADPINLGVTNLVWTFDGGTAHITAGAGLIKTGNQLDVGAGTGIQVLGDSVGIAAGGVDATQLADLGVTTAKLNDLSVTNGKLAASAVTDAKVAAGAAIAQTKIAGLTTALSDLDTAIDDEAAARGAADATLTTAVALKRDISSTAPLTLIAPSAVTVPLILQGAVGQNTDLLQVKNSAGDVGFRVTRDNDLRWLTNAGTSVAIATFDVPWTNGPVGDPDYPVDEPNYTDHLAVFGYNVGAGGSFITPGEAMAWLQFEHRFFHTFPSGDSDFGSEIHFNFRNPSGVGGAYRPYGASYNHRTGEISNATRGSWVWQHSTTDDIALQLHETSKLLSLASDFSLSITPNRTDRALFIDIGGRAGNYPSIFVQAGVDQTQPLIDLRKADNSSVFNVMPDGTVNFPGSGISALTGSWSWEATAGGTLLGYWNHTEKKVEFLEDVWLQMTPTSTNRAAVRLGDTDPYPSLFVSAGSTQTSDLMDLRTAGNVSQFRVAVDGTAKLGSTLAMNTPVDRLPEGLISGDVEAADMPFLYGRAHASQTANLVEIKTADATGHLFSIDADGYPILCAPGGARWQVSVDDAGAIVTTVVA